MTKEVSAKKQTIAGAIPIITDGPANFIYADTIIDFGVGPSVTRLNLGMETGPNSYTRSATLIIPTSSMIAALASVQEQIRNNEVLKTQLTTAIDAVKEQINKF
jgi:hypothetical protein